MIFGFDHVTFSVKDLSRSLAFYRDILGFKPFAKSRNSIYLKAGDAQLVLTTKIESECIAHDECTHLALRVKGDEFAEYSERILDSECTFWNEYDRDALVLYFRDLDGHRLELRVESLFESFIPDKPEDFELL